MVLFMTGLVAFAFGRNDKFGAVVVHVPPATDVVPATWKVKSQPIVSLKISGNA